MNPHSLTFVFDGWVGYNLSLRKAIEARSREELDWRPTSDLPSVGEVAAHLALGRIIWFVRMDAPLSREMAERFKDLRDSDRNWVDPTFCGDATRLVELIDASWQMIGATLLAWTVDDLSVSYPHEYQGTKYAVSRQWTIWRILTHDIHHGGQISEMLFQQSIEIEELGNQGGHLTEPPVWQ